MAEAGGSAADLVEAGDTLKELPEDGGCLDDLVEAGDSLEVSEAAADLVEAVDTLEELVEDGGRLQYDPKHENPPNSQSGQSLTV